MRSTIREVSFPAHFHINKETSNFEGYCRDGFTYTPLLSSRKPCYTYFAYFYLTMTIGLSTLCGTTIRLIIVSVVVR